MSNSFFTREDTNFFKAVGIILIVLHHVFFIDWYIDGIECSVDAVFAPYFRNFMGFAFVPMFAFITGYFYCFKQDFSWKYTLKKYLIF